MQTQVGVDFTATRARIDRLGRWVAFANPKVRAFTSRSMSDGRPNDTITAASFLGPYAGVIDHLGETLDHFDRIAQLVDFIDVKL